MKPLKKEPSIYAEDEVNMMASNTSLRLDPNKLLRNKSQEPKKKKKDVANEHPSRKVKTNPQQKVGSNAQEVASSLSPT